MKIIIVDPEKIENPFEVRLGEMAKEEFTELDRKVFGNSIAAKELWARCQRNKMGEQKSLSVAFIEGVRSVLSHAIELEELDKPDKEGWWWFEYGNKSECILISINRDWHNELFCHRQHLAPSRYLKDMPNGKWLYLGDILRAIEEVQK